MLDQAEGPVTAVGSKRSFDGFGQFVGPEPGSLAALGMTDKVGPFDRNVVWPSVLALGREGVVVAVPVALE